MNAIIGLCHFCEAHGPRPFFCTFTTDDEKHAIESSKSTVECSGCNSLGSETVLVSKDDDGTIYCSRESIPNADITAFLRQAAIRSITCEVSWSKEGGVVYFSDTGGHVLSFSFQLRDTRARGLKRWFSIVVLMKDKMLLLNLTPLLSEHMQKISKELQQLADVVYNEEQNICSQRALRLNTGRNDFGQSRSLKQLTGDENVFKSLHSQFTWMLKAGALTYSETLYTSQDLFNKLQLKTISNSIFKDNACLVPTVQESMPLRRLENLLTKCTFRTLLYCTLTGVEIIIKSSYTDSSTIIRSLERLIPVPNIDKVKTSTKYELNSANKCIINENENGNFVCDWLGTLPDKCPTVMNKIEKAMNNEKLNDEVLHQHIKSLLLEWLGIANTIKSAMDSAGAKSDAVIKLKQVLGVTQHDDLLLNYWITAYC